MKRQKSKLTGWFIRCLNTYVSIFVIVLALVLVMYGRLEKSTEATVRSSYQRQIETAIDTIVQSLDRSVVSATMLTADNSVVQLTRATPESLPNEVMDMNAAHDSLERSYVQMGDEYLGAFVIYAKNHYLVTNSFVSNDYEKEYGPRFSFGDLTSDEWYKLMLADSPLQSRLDQSISFFSYDLGGTSHDVLPFIVPLTNTMRTSRTGVIVYLLDAEWCRKLLQTEEGICFALTAPDGKLLLGSTFDRDEGEYLILSVCNDVAPRFSLELAVPRDLIDEKLSSVTRIIKLYILMGLVGVLLLSVVYALRHFRSIRRIIDVSSEVQPEKYSSPYLCVQDIFHTLSQARDSMQQRIILMESTYANNLLVNVCLRGVASNEEFKECSRLLGERETGYCVVMLKMDHGLTASPAFIEVETQFQEQTDALVIRSTPNESVFIVSIVNEEARNSLQTLVLELFAPFGCTGISAVMDDVRVLHSGYQQAYGCSVDCEGDERCVLYAENCHVKRSFYPDYETLTALQKYIFDGKTDRIAECFAEIAEKTRHLVGIEQFQTFFVLRQALLRIGSNIQGETHPSDRLNFIYDESSLETIERLRQYALTLALNANNNKCDKTDHSANAIINIIESDFSNPNLSSAYLAEKLNCSEKYIYQKIKDHTGMTLGDFIEETRLRFATELLLNTDKKNEEIAMLCGFGALNTFYRIFRKKYGMTPGEWRKQQFDNHMS